MDLLGILLLAFALAMDAFAVSLCKGFSVKALKIEHYVKVGLYFGGFQGIMPLLGYALGVSFRAVIEDYDHWIAFVLLSIIGGKMIAESFKPQTCEANSSEFGIRTMSLLGIATSIDALIIGISLATLEANIWLSALSIGAITAICCICGLKIGHIFGLYLGKKAELLGGIILIVLGVKILVEHTLLDSSL